MRALYTFILLFIAMQTWAARPQKREVVIDTVCHAPLEVVLQMAEMYCRHFQSCPDSLYQWAYVGIDPPDPKKSKNKESRDAIQLHYKDRKYDPVTKTGDVAIDIYVLGARWWKDQHLGTHLVLSQPALAPYPLTALMRATYSGSILHGGHFMMRLEPISDQQTRVHYEFSLTFGKVLSAFISDKTWQNAIEWRFVIILKNLLDCAEHGGVLPQDRPSENG